jgi:hypothetical protein
MLPYPAFLYGDKLRLANLSLIINYEILHNLFREIDFTYSNTSDEDALRTPDYQIGKKLHSGYLLVTDFKF